jgi:Radical SAM superfamily
MNSTLRILGKAAVANLLPASLFDSSIGLESVRELFSAFVRVVEIENHSYCNRTCAFCPNAFIDRRSQNVLMTNELFERILDDLASIDYSQSLVWSRYHEPLADASIFERVAQARSRLPRAHLVMISNGDYLNRDSLRQLEQAGVNRMMLDLYLPEGRERDAAQIEVETKKFAARTGLTLEMGGDFEFVCTGSSIKITMGVPRYTGPHVSTRGGLVSVASLRSYQRRSVCFNPVHSVVVDYNGKGMLCCQVRSDAAAQESAIIADLAQNGYGLFHFYRDLAPARKGLLSPGPKTGVCSTCNVSDVGPDKLARGLLGEGISRLPGMSALVTAAARRANGRRKYE